MSDVQSAPPRPPNGDDDDTAAVTPSQANKKPSTTTNTTTKPKTSTSSTSSPSTVEALKQEVRRLQAQVKLINERKKKQQALAKLRQQQQKQREELKEQQQQQQQQEHRPDQVQDEAAEVATAGPDGSVIQPEEDDANAIVVMPDVVVEEDGRLPRSQQVQTADTEPRSAVTLGGEVAVAEEEQAQIPPTTTMTAIGLEAEPVVVDETQQQDDDGGAAAAAAGAAFIVPPVSSELSSSAVLRPSQLSQTDITDPAASMDQSTALTTMTTTTTTTEISPGAADGAFDRPSLVVADAASTATGNVAAAGMLQPTGYGLPAPMSPSESALDPSLVNAGEALQTIVPQGATSSPKSPLGKNLPSMSAGKRKRSRTPSASGGSSDESRLKKAGSVKTGQEQEEAVAHPGGHAATPPPPPIISEETGKRVSQAARTDELARAVRAHMRATLGVGEDDPLPGPESGGPDWMKGPKNRANIEWHERMASETLQKVLNDEGHWGVPESQRDLETTKKMKKRAKAAARMDEEIPQKILRMDYQSSENSSEGEDSGLAPGEWDRAANMTGRADENEKVLEIRTPRWRSDELNDMYDRIDAMSALLVAEVKGKGHIQVPLRRFKLDPLREKLPPKDADEPWMFVDGVVIERKPPQKKRAPKKPKTPKTTEASEPVTETEQVTANFEEGMSVPDPEPLPQDGGNADYAYDAYVAQADDDDMAALGLDPELLQQQLDKMGYDASGQHYLDVPSLNDQFLTYQ